ncbi:MAG: saccharopine dehydrogenase NADP-binding domain-containing protein [Solirubrobacterales bacterium]
MRVAVLGAGGTIAPAIVRDLAESDEISELALLDLDAERAGAVAEAHGGGKATATRVDATATGAQPGSLPGALAGCGALVNSASYRINLEAMRACLEAGCHYLDLGGLYWMTGRQLELSGEFEAAGLTAVLGIGSAPGKTNLMARVAAERLGGSADEVRVWAAGRDPNPPGSFSVPYSVRTLVDELTMAPVVLRGGEPTEIEPMADGGSVDFGDPIGEGATIYTLHSEMRTFGASFGAAEGSFRLSLAPVVLERLRELIGNRAAPGRQAEEAGLDSEIDAAAREALPPSPHTASVHLVEAARDGRVATVRAVTRPHEGWGLGGGIVSTAAPAAAAARMFARGSIEVRGALPPEGCIDPEEMFAELERRGATFEVDVSEGVLA